MTAKRLVIAGLAVVLFLSVASLGQVPTQFASDEVDAKSAASLPAAIWRDPGDPATLDLFYGPGGKDHAPSLEGSFTFVSEVLSGTSPKFDVEDSHGVRWRVKLGDEASAETAATRLLWAAGYFTDEAYYGQNFKVEGLRRLQRGQQDVVFVKSKDSAHGVVRHARLERKTGSPGDLGTWDWFDNPFVGTREFDGLRAIMALVNNWDVRVANNSIYLADGERRFVVSDVGATFGKTGTGGRGSKSNLEDYSKAEFISETTPDHVDLVMHKPPFVLAPIFPVYRNLARQHEVAKDIPRAHAKWIGERLAQLSENQIRDCFRSAGYSSAEVDGFTKVVQERIAALAAL